MLIENKFIYLSLPRCASTAFHYSCIVNNLDIKTNNGEWEISNSEIDFSTIDKLDIMNHIYHGHESIDKLQIKFGNEFPIIAVKRDRHERFYSLYKHILFDFQRLGFARFFETFSKITLDELFFFTKDDLLTKKKRWDKICEFLIELNLLDEKIDISVTSKFNKSQEEYSKINTKGYAVNMIDILLTPISHWTGNNPNIIWFDIKEMDELEKWVSTTINKSFQIHSLNSSKHMECDLVFDENFVKKYNSIYDYYDFPKLNKTLI
jgi:hypothetical protein